ncbi:MAG: hypothetical protein KBD12_02925 [Candidatus Pacebacteria bacterium]|nr:hypothetical protein [Candidatus Paceibacterota bacterium]
MKKIIFSLLMVSSLALVSAQSVPATSVGNLDDLKAKIVSLENLYTDLKAKVASGAITKDAASATWKQSISDFKTEKQKVFDQKREELKLKIESLKSENKEKKEALKKEIASSTEAIKNIQTQRKSIQDKLKAGTITKTEAETQLNALKEEGKKIKEERIEDRKERLEDRKENREEINKNRAEGRKEIKEDRAEIRDERQEGRQERKDMRATPKPVPAQ